MIKNIKEFTNLLAKKRNSGRVTCCVKEINNAAGIATVDSFVKELGFKPIGEEWELITQQTARNILIYLFSMDMAYNIELDSKPLADKLSYSFLSGFSSGAKIFTNGYFDKDSGFFALRGWQPLSNATFDTDIVILDANKIGILWVEDED